MKNDDDRVCGSRTFLRSRQGWRDEKYMDLNLQDLSKKHRSITRTGCMAKLIVKLEKRASGQ